MKSVALSRPYTGQQRWMTSWCTCNSTWAHVRELPGGWRGAAHLSTAENQVYETNQPAYRFGSPRPSFFFNFPPHSCDHFLWISDPRGFLLSIRVLWRQRKATAVAPPVQSAWFGRALGHHGGIRQPKGSTDDAGRWVSLVVANHTSVV